MQSTTRFLPDVAALLAMVIGLYMAGQCNADGPGGSLHVPVGPHSGTGRCVSSLTYCWQSGCIMRYSNDDPSPWECGGSTFNYYKRVAQQYTGSCNTENMPCTYYDEVYCAQISCYQDDGCMDALCSYYLTVTNQCVPGA